MIRKVFETPVARVTAVQLQELHLDQEQELAEVVRDLTSTRQVTIVALEVGVQSCALPASLVNADGAQGQLSDTCPARPDPVWTEKKASNPPSARCGRAP